MDVVLLNTITPKANASIAEHDHNAEGVGLLSPGFERSENPGYRSKFATKP